MISKKFFSFLIISIFFSLQINAQDDVTYDTNSKCGSCTIKPGQLNKFKDALTDSKLHYYTNGGKTKLDLKKANKECDSSYFFLCKDMLVLSSAGTKKDRTELRQKKKLSLNDASSMYFDAIIVNTPKTNKKKGVTIGQIHNSADGVKRPLLRIEIAGGNQIRSVVTNTYVKGEGKVKNDFLVPFKDGDNITCKIKIKKSGNEIMVEVKNITKNLKQKISYKVNDLWLEKDGEFYFKAGAYTQVTGPETKIFYNEFRYKY